MIADCICTGIILIEDDCAYRGDLFQMGDTYIVNCVDVAMPAIEATVAPEVRWIRPKNDYWTRKGVFVIKVADAELSHAANAYIGN